MSLSNLDWLEKDEKIKRSEEEKIIDEIEKELDESDMMPNTPNEQLILIKKTNTFPIPCHYLSKRQQQH